MYPLILTFFIVFSYIFAQPQSIPTWYIIRRCFMKRFAVFHAHNSHSLVFNNLKITATNDKAILFR